MPYIGTAVNSGTTAFNGTNQTVNSPGIARLTSSTTLNSGYRWQTDANIRIGGREIHESRLMFLNIPNINLRIGFHDSNSVADAVDGAGYFEITGGGVAVFKTANNNARTTSVAVATLTNAIFYKFRVTVNSDATSVLGQIFDNNNVLVGSATITTNIPNALGRELASGILCINGGTIATAMIDVDYIKTILNPIR